MISLEGGYSKPCKKAIVDWHLVPHGTFIVALCEGLDGYHI